MKVHLVPHQHFDLVWRRPSRWYAEHRAALYRQAFGMLEKYSDFTFSFSQSLALREFLDADPGMRSVVAEFIRQGRLEWIGGQLSIADVNLCSPMALVRNIEAGLKYLRDTFGYEVRIGAFEDAFGVSAQLPQLLSLSGYEFYKAGRMPRAVSPEPTGCFRWEAQDGSLIRCVANSPDGLSWGWGNLDNPDEPHATMQERRNRLEQELRAAVAGAEKAGLEQALVTVMGEEQDIFPEIVELVRELQKEFSERGIELFFSTHEAFCRSISEKEWTETPVYHSDEDFSRIFTGCYTSRIESKTHPRLLENELLAAEFTGPVAPQCRETLALLQFHDAICGCHIDENADFLTKKYEECRKVLKGLPHSLPWRRLWHEFGPPGPWRSVSEKNIAWGRWRLEFDNAGRPGSLTFDSRAVPIPQIVAREENGTLWTEEYSGREAFFQALESAAEISFHDDELQLRTDFYDRNFRNYWTGFSRLRYTKTLKFRKDSPWMEVSLSCDFLGNSTELSVRLALAGSRFRSGTAEIPFGTVARQEYSRELTRSENFPALNFVSFGDFLWLNAGTPGHAFRTGGLENLFLRSPVKRWAPWFPVTPTPAMWDNGPREYRFALCADASSCPPGDKHRIGAEFQLAANNVSFESVVPSWAMDLPENLVIAGIDGEGFLWLYECAGRETVWASRNLIFAPRQIRKVKL